MGSSTMAGAMPPDEAKPAGIAARSWTRRSLTALALGSWAGMCAGIATALADFGAHWLFMESALDRVWLGLRLLSLQAATGVLLGAAGAIAFCAVRAISTRTRGSRVEVAAVGLLLAAPSFWLSRQLWSGGMMARLPLRALGIAATWLTLTLALAGAYALGTRVLTRAVGAPAPLARRRLILGLAAAFALGKLNQLVLPALYDYLHAALSLATFALYAAGALAVSLRLGPERLRRFGLVSAAAVLGLGFLSAYTLEANQNVRVALLSPHMPNSRALLQAAGPWLPQIDAQSVFAAKQRAAAARQRRAQAAGGAQLPQVPDAHVLLITVDALRADHLGLYGYKRPTTPELDRLAADAVVFERAYAQAPHSSYSLCSLMTSEYLHETTELGATPPTQTLPRVLAETGYHTAGFYTQGIFHTAAAQLGAYERDAFGFALHDHQDRPAEQMTDRVLAEMDRTLTRGEPSALFWVHYFDVHEPYEATTFGTQDIDRYDSELLATDAAIGRLVRQARARLRKPLVIVITADHGEEFHEHGGVYHGSSLYDEQLRVPLILSAPGLTPQRIAQPVEIVDLAPTLLELVDVERPQSMRGSDLRRLLGPTPAERGPVFSAVIHKKMVLSWPYKLIADLRFGAFELYDLREDPHERDNLADREPERVGALRGEVYAWLDSLAPASGQVRQHAQALEWGRLGDRRAVSPLSDLLVDETADARERCEAARLLGRLADRAASDRLLSATHARDAWVAAEAAIALGRMSDERARSALRRLVTSEDLGIRSRAAVSLARLRDIAAVPALTDALWVAPDLYEREEAVRWLGRLGDSSALEALLNVLPDSHTRHLVAAALGELGDVRAYGPLLDVIASDRNSNVRDGAVRGLAMLGDARAIPVLLRLVTEDPSLHNTSEALVRLRAIERKHIGGADLEPNTRGTSGLSNCQRGPWRHDWDFLHRTYCESDRDAVALRLPVPDTVAAATSGTTLLLEWKRLDASAGTTVTLRLGAYTAQLTLDGVWREARVELPEGALPRGAARLTLNVDQPGARFALDHVLFVPRSGAEAVATKVDL